MKTPARGRGTPATDRRGAGAASAPRKTLDPEQVETFATGLSRPVDLKFAPDGTLLILLRDAWVKDEAFRGGTGSLHRIRYRDAR